MAHASPLDDRSPGRVKGGERAQRAPEGRFHARAPVMDGPARERASRRQRADAAGGVEGVTKEPYGRALEAHLQGRHARLKAQRSRPPPIRRVPIPTGAGKTRPIGMSACEDTLVHDAVREGLEALDAPDFLDGS